MKHRAKRQFNATMHGPLHVMGDISISVLIKFEAFAVNAHNSTLGFLMSPPGSLKMFSAWFATLLIVILFPTP